MDESPQRRKMQQVIDLVVGDIGSIRTGRATSSLVEGLELSLYGNTQKLRLLEVATITTPDAQAIVIDPWDK